jgi:hypothetical protein
MHLNCSGKDASTTLSPRNELQCFQALFFFLLVPDLPAANSCFHLQNKKNKKLDLSKQNNNVHSQQEKQDKA